MRPIVRFQPLAIVLTLLLAACGGGTSETALPSGNEALPASAPPAAPDKMEVRVWTASGKILRLNLELAADEKSQEHGLMGRRELTGDGMLFPFPYPATASFWMKDTPIPLDLIFVRPDGTIAGILEGKPNDLTPISAGEAVSAVIELKRGRAKELGISGGDQVQWGDCSEADKTPPSGWRADRFCPNT